jgi:hypothetical protein
MHPTIKTFGLAGMLCAAAVVVAPAAMAMPLGDSSAATPHGIDAARESTAKYRSVTTAKRQGYGVLKDAKGIGCIDKPGEGGMGVHYAKPKLVGDGAVKVTTPDVLVYERKANGRLRLVAVEYVVFQDAWDKKHSSVPKLFGRAFALLPAGNRYGLPPFYELHAWIWKANPSGMFADWNPRVTC